MEIFQGDAARGALSLANECLADAVVFDETKTGLLARELLEVTLGRLGVGALESMTETGVSLPNGLDMSTRVVLPVAVGGQVANAEVDAEPTFGINRRSFRNLHGDVEVELPFTGHEVGLATNPIHLAPVVGPDDNRHDETLVEGGERNAIKPVLEGVESLVVGNGAIGSEARQLGLVSLVRLANLGDAAHGKLGVESESGPDLVVVELLELELVGGLQIEGFGREPVASLVEAGHEVHEGGLLLRFENELASGDQLHVHRTTSTMVECQGHFLPDLKDGASVACSRKERVTL